MADETLEARRERLRGMGIRAAGDPPFTAEELDAVDRRKRAERAARRAAQPTSDAQVEQDALDHAIRSSRNVGRGPGVGNLGGGRAFEGSGGGAPRPLQTELPKRSAPVPQSASPRRTPPIPGGGLASRVPAGDSSALSTWSPDPNMVLVLGAGLVLLSVVSKQSALQALYKLFWVQGDHPTQTLGRTLLADAIFLTVLYILANLSDMLARAVVLFELGLYLIWFVSNPGMVVTFANFVSVLTPGTQQSQSKGK